MADENNTMTNTEAAAVIETPLAAKKSRKPRAKKTASDVTSAEAVSQKASGTPEKKRGRKPNSMASATTAKAPRVVRDPKVVPAAPASSTASDEMADLLRLEEENQRLRKLLAEKLRAENADLRKKLNLD